MKIRALVFALTAAFLAACGQSDGLRAGQTVNGVLEAKDAAESDGSIIDTYTLRGEEGQSFVVRLSSDAFDPYLRVVGPGDLARDNDDDPTSQGSLNSMLAFTFPETGVARIYVTSYQRNGVGAYTLSVEQPASGAPGGETTAPTEAPAQVNQVMDGELAQGDATLQSGEFVDTYPFSGQAGQQLEIALTSTAFDPYVAITGPDGFHEFNDDDAENGTRNSRLITTLPGAGDYVIHVTSYAAGESGAYHLEVRPTSATSPNSLAGGAAGGTALNAGQNMTGALAQGDETLRSGEFIDRFRFTGQSGQRVTIDMRSSEFDPYLMLVAPSGAQEDNDDATPGDTRHSRIETQLGESGEYSIVATSYRPGETGNYTVNLVQGAASQAPITGPSARRIFAVSVGISDYPGADNDLPFTAEDARKMRDTLSRQGVLASESVTLIDAQATRQGVRNAFQRVAAAAGPEDLFLFFYSGHGGQVRGQSSAIEPDGKDETLVLYDGEIRDDELARMFEQVRSRTALVILDSCFSGGFARDVVSHPGRMGLFSSEEDLTSAVADKFQAGGYLSHFVQTGLSGAADENRDRVITAGELSAYVRREFAEQVRDVSSVTMEGQRNYQFPVVDRGAVQIDSPVLSLR